MKKILGSSRIEFGFSKKRRRRRLARNIALGSLGALGVGGLVVGLSRRRGGVSSKDSSPTTSDVTVSTIPRNKESSSVFLARTQPEKIRNRISPSQMTRIRRTNQVLEGKRIANGGLDLFLEGRGYSRSQQGMIGRVNSLSGTASYRMGQRINQYKWKIEDTPGYRIRRKDGNSPRSGKGTARKFDSRGNIPGPGRYV